MPTTSWPDLTALTPVQGERDHHWLFHCTDEETEVQGPGMLDDVPKVTHSQEWQN